MIGDLMSSALRMLPGGGKASAPEVIDALRRIDIFEGIRDNDRALARIAAQAERKRFEQGEVLVEQNKHGLGMYAIVSGHVNVEFNGTKVNDLGPGAVVAEMSLLDDKPRSATVRATEPTDTLLFTRDIFKHLVNQTPQLGLGLAKNLAERLRVANEATARGGGAAPKPDPATTEVATDAVGPSPIPPPPPDSKSVEAHGPGAKESIQKALLSAFDKLYTAKAFTRFSVAVLGCPVEGVSPFKVGEIRMGEVKAVAIRHGVDRHLDIVATESGHFTLHLYQPDCPHPARYGPTLLLPGQACRLQLTSSGPEITLDGYRI